MGVCRGEKYEVKKKKETGYVNCYPDKRLKRLSSCNTCKHSFIFEGVTRCGYKKEKSGLPLER